MNSFRLLDRRNGYVVAAFALVLSAIVPAIASAAQLTERSIGLSSSSVDADGVTYTINFNAISEADALIVDFCGNTPLYGEDCTTPSGFSFGTLGTTASGFTVDSNDANTLRLEGDIQPGSRSFAVSGINNPDTAGPLYARIATFATTANAAAYVSNPVEPAVNTGLVDSGSVAISITPTVGVSGAVRESMTFCVAKDAIADDCDLVGNFPPNIQLGQDDGSGIALNSLDLSEGTIHTQISTNAAGGAVISLKSNALGCGGLLRAGAPGICDIKPALASGFAAGEAKFGLKTGAADSDANGDIRPFDSGSGAYYNNTTFKLNYVDNATGITSTYGDPLLDTNSKPANNKNMPLTFGASVSNNTPAGSYSADLSLIATGKF